MTRLAISFSGGRSSAYMSQICFQRFRETHEIKACFCNTGEEDNRTLDFVHACDEHIFGGELVWIEAVIHGAGKGPTAKVVTYETASRHDGGNPTPMEMAEAKHGVFGPTHKQCNSRLKTEPMLWWRASEGWAPGTYDTAVGIRADEIDRCSQFADRDRIVYPLIDAGVTKGDANKWCAQFDWDLKLPSDAWGNCRWCYKKTLRKLMTVAKADPTVFDNPAKYEKQFGHINNGKTVQTEPRVHYRERRSAQDIVTLSQTTEFREYRDSNSFQPGLFSQDLDIGGGCGESCEIGADD